MAKKEFKAESKRLMDLMINSIYTNKEIFLREIISNASDAIDKLYYRSLTDKSVKVKQKDFEINISIDKNARTLTISDNGCGMTKEELENNLGTIAKSGSKLFKDENEHKKDIDIIGQFGVGFYSSFMVSKNVKVISKSYDNEEAYQFSSDGIDGYTIEKSNRDSYGTDVILTIRDDVDNDEVYSEYLDSYRIKELVRKYSDYITYPIKMEIEHEHLKENSDNEYEKEIVVETINSLIPLWKRNKRKITEEEYNTFYSDKFFDYENPLKVIHSSSEGKVNFHSMLFIPSHAPYNYYTKDYEKGLQLYSNGVLIMEKCADLLPDYFSFVKGVVDSPDLSLNISREILQQDKILKTISKNIETKIIKELSTMLFEQREKYEEFHKSFGMQLKFGVYNNYGVDKDKLKDLIMFTSSNEKKLITLKEYVNNIKEDQEVIYYASGESVDKIDMMPQVELVKDKGFEILYLSDYVDEFVVQILGEYDGKKFVNVSSKDLNLDSKEEEEKLIKENEKNKDMFDFMKSEIPSVKDIRFTHRLKNHPVCLSTEGEISTEMEKVINAMPTDEKISATTILEINENHDIAKKLKDLYKNDKEVLKQYSKILYAQARLIEGLPIDNPTEISNLICMELSK